MAGRPIKYPTEEIIKALKAKRGMVYLAAEMIGCSPDAIYLRAKNVPAVAKCIGNERGKLIDTAEMKLADGVEAGEPWAIRMLLYTLGKDRGYVERQETDHMGSTTMELVHEIVTTQADLESLSHPDTGEIPHDRIGSNGQSNGKA